MKHDGVEPVPIRVTSIIVALMLLTACDSRMNSAEKARVEIGSAESCDASVQSCLLAHDGVEMRLAVEKEVHPLQPFQMQLQVAGIEAIEAVNVEFFMEGMDMGLNRYRLVRNNNNSWQGMITLPVCVAGRSYWRAEVEVIGQKSRYHGTFGFHSSK